MSKNIKKELKQPDEFVSFWTHAGQQATRVYASRKRAIVFGASALVTVVVGSIVFSQVAERRSIRGSHAIERVEKITTADLIPEGGTAKDDGVPHFKTEKERVQAALKEVDAFIAAEPRSPLHVEAQLHRGGLLLDLDRADEAVTLYQELVDGKLDGRLRFLAREGLGYAYERKGALDQALATFAKLGDDAAAMGAFYKDRAVYQRARLSEIRGNRNEAAKLYHEVLEKNPNTSLRDTISNRLAVLELQ